MSTVLTQTLGYPRIGRHREMKRALEAYWSGAADAKALYQTLDEVETAAWQAQLDAGVERIGVGDASLYDPILDWTLRFGLIPTRFHTMDGLTRYFAMARGAPGCPALEMTKWFDTNYHYLVPEIRLGMHPQPNFDDFLDTIARARALLGDRAVPIIPGPLTFLQLARLDVLFLDALEHLLPSYKQLLTQLHQLGVAEIQLHEPILVRDSVKTLQTAVRNAYKTLAEIGPALNLVATFDDPGENFTWITTLPFEIFTLDFTRGRTIDLLSAHGWPAGKTLAAGVIDGRNIWRIQPAETLTRLKELSSLTPLRISLSCSLQFVPHNAARETHLPAELRNVLAFAEEKLGELQTLALAMNGDPTGLSAIESAWRAFEDFAPENPQVSQQMDALEPGDFQRSRTYVERRPQQIQLPLFPTTTIGSFPQTSAVRRLRTRYNKGEISTAEYQAGIDTWIAYTIGIQEGLGLDVLVHGEFERTDMVEYFANKLQGFAFTEEGWVQSFGSRYVRPPIIYGDIFRPEPMTVREFRFAQSLTPHPVKGMLTGPITLLNWSYPRTDLLRREIAFQLALALRAEIADLEAAGARIIQVDEPALREGLPLNPARHEEYLTWAVDAFRLATARAAPQTQIHTHMCYAEFGAILSAIDRMDADVISIENARSGDETLEELAAYGYQREVGPGVYDIHSPVVPETEAIFARLRAFLRHLRPEQIWINPDCGLKTRTWEEVLPALRHIITAVSMLRRELNWEEMDEFAVEKPPAIP